MFKKDVAIGQYHYVKGPSPSAPTANIKPLHCGNAPPVTALDVARSCPLPETKSPELSPKSKKSNNRLYQTVAGIAQKHGHDPHSVVPLFHHLSSTDFCLGPPAWTSSMGQIPGAVWKAVSAHYNLAAQRPFRRLSAAGNPTVFKEKSPVFVARKYTEKLVASEQIVEGFSTAQRLYQYLNWTMRINKVSESMNLLEGRHGAKVLLINTELHDRERRELYALCIRNDVVSVKAQKWQLAALLTASQLSSSLGIDYHHFPRGVRASSPQFEELRMMKQGVGQNSLRALKQRIRERDAQRKIIRYQQLKCVLAGNGRTAKRKPSSERVLTVHLSSFYAKVREALHSPLTPLLPMVSIVSRKLYQRKEEDFSVDYLLPVRVGQDWVGVVFRDMEPIMALMDIYDITNKALLCDPAVDVEALPFAQSPFNRLKILPDHQWDTSSMEWVAMYSNAYFEQFRPPKTRLVPSNYHR